MQPTALQSSYERYKLDTDSVAGWLASTAKAHGYTSPKKSAPEQKQTPISRQAKRQAEKKADKQAKKEAKDKSGGSGTGHKKYIIAIKEFRPLAEFIAASKPAISIPAVFIRTLERVIKLRSLHADQRQELGLESDDEADASHTYFIDILKQVWTALKPLFAPFQTTPATTANRLYTLPLSNAFEGLNVEEPSQEFLDAPDVERPAPLDNAQYEVEPLVAYEELAFAYYLMNIDLKNIRFRIQWIWVNYSKGYMDLAAAAVATNTATELVRSFTKGSIIDSLEAHGGAYSMSENFYLLSCVMNGASKEEAVKHLMDRFTADQQYDMANEGDFIAHCLAKHLELLIEQDPLPKKAHPLDRILMIDDPSLHKLDLEKDRRLMSGREKYEEDMSIIQQMYVDALTAIDMSCFPVEDEFTRGIKELSETGKAPFYLVFAIQSYLDIIHFLRADSAKGFETMMREMDAMETDIKSFIDFHGNSRRDIWPANNDAILNKMVKNIGAIRDDLVYSTRLELLEKHGLVRDASMVRHRTLKHSPVMAGLVLFYYRARMLDPGFGAANAWGSITYAAHLYNALSSEGLLTRSWPDMMVTQKYIQKSLFVGSAPRNVDDYHSRFLLQMGISIAALKAGEEGRKPKKMSSSRGGRSIKNELPVTSMFLTRYLNNRASMIWTVEDIEKIIARRKVQMVDRNADSAFSEQDEKKSGDQRALTSADILIRELAMALHGEVLEMTWPLLAMHQQSLKLLNRVKASCDPLLREIYSLNYNESPSSLPWVVGWSFHAAKHTSTPPDWRPMRAAAAAMNEFIQGANGMATVKLCEERLRAHIRTGEEDLMLRGIPENGSTWVIPPTHSRE